MRTHVNVVAWLHIVFSTLFTLACVGYGALAVFMGQMGQQMPPSEGTTPAKADTMGLDPGAVFSTFRMAGWLIILLGVVVGIPGVIAGIGLLRLKPWARILGIVVSILGILTFTPIHMGLGVYGLVILLNQETVQLFKPMPTLIAQDSSP